MPVTLRRNAINQSILITSMKAGHNFAIKSEWQSYKVPAKLITLYGNKEHTGKVVPVLN
jgi:hypothetical protein